VNVKAKAITVGKGFLVGYVIVFALITLFQRSFIYQSWSIDFTQANRRPMGKGLAQIVVTTSDREMVKAYWRPPAPGMPVIISFHGNAATPQYYADRFAGKPWSDRGYGILAMTYRGYPGSTGEPDESGLLDDGRAAYDFVRKTVPNSQIVLHGHSLGSGVAVAIAAERGALALILDAPFTSLEDVVADKFPVMPTFMLFDTYRSDERIKDVKAERIFVTHGTSDTVIPFELGKTLASLRTDITFYVIPGGGHYDIMGRKDVDMERAITPLVRRPNA